MYRILLSLIFLLSVCKLEAQRPSFDKMSPFVREAMVDELTTRRLTRSVGNQRILTAFVRINGDAEKVLHRYGCRELARVGDISIAAIPLDRLGELSLCKQVTKIESGKRCSVQMDTTAVVINALPAQQGVDFSQAYTGKGVVVGVQDIGFDLTHPTFYSADMSRYRIKAMWDQLSKDSVGTGLYVGRDYVGEQALLQVGHPVDGLTETHGTHTAGIAAGSGAEGNGVVSPYRGIAYDADLVLVDNAAGDNVKYIDPKDYYKFTYATDALGFKYIFDYADQQRKPCVINFSEGSTQDIHGYDQLYYELLSSLTGPGHIIVSSAGNNGAKRSYIHKPAGQEKAGTFLVGEPNTASVTCTSVKPFVFRTTIYNVANDPKVFDIPTTKVCAARDSLFTDSVVIDGKKYLWKVLAYPNSYNHAKTAYDFLIKSTALGQSTSVSLQLVGRDADIELYRMSGDLQTNSLDPSLNAGEFTHSIFSPSSAPCVISVGATGYRTSFINYLGEKKVYNNGEHGARAPFSAVGPTFDGRVKPDVMAPGQNIISAYSSFYISTPTREDGSAKNDIKSDVRHFEYNGRTYAWNANAGTSMSAPVVTGAIALWLEANPKLTPADCIDIFKQTCTHYDTSLSYPNNLYGYGQIDVTKGLKEVLRKQALGITKIEKVVTDDHIYLLDGRCVGTSVENLPKGIYIKNGRKFVK